MTIMQFAREKIEEFLKEHPSSLDETVSFVGGKHAWGVMYSSSPAYKQAFEYTGFWPEVVVKQDFVLGNIYSEYVFKGDIQYQLASAKRRVKALEKIMKETRWER